MIDCLTVAYYKGKMKRDSNGAPEGSRVHAQTKDGVKNQSGPNWSDLASRDQTWSILNTLEDVAKIKNKKASQVAIR